MTIEYTIMKQANPTNRPKVVVKYFEVLGHWGICHENSHQNASRRKYPTKHDAEGHAKQMGYIVVERKYDS
jgi:hypothetical protein